MRNPTFFKHALRVLALVVAAAAVIGALVQHLWNWLAPVLFHLPAITYWQAIGLAVLARLLVGHGGRHGHHGPRMFGHGRDIDMPGGRGGWRRYAAFWNEEGRVRYEDWLGRQDKER
jgi:hypothetical protein